MKCQFWFRGRLFYHRYYDSLAFFNQISRMNDRKKVHETTKTNFIIDIHSNNMAKQRSRPVCHPPHSECDSDSIRRMIWSSEWLTDCLADWMPDSRLLMILIHYENDIFIRRALITGKIECHGENYRGSRWEAEDKRKHIIVINGKKFLCVCVYIFVLSAI